MNIEKIRQRLIKYYETATPEQVVQELERLGVDLIDIEPEIDDQESYLKIQINDVKRLLDLVKDHPLMSIAYQCRLEMLESLLGEHTKNKEKSKSDIEKFDEVVENLKVFIVEITEYERGWGCRPDGYLAFKNEELADKFLKEVYDSRSSKLSDVPDCYDDYKKIGYGYLHSKENYQVLEENGRIWIKHYNKCI